MLLRILMREAVCDYNTIKTHNIFTLHQVYLQTGTLCNGKEQRTLFDIIQFYKQATASVAQTLVALHGSTDAQQAQSY